ncbi:MAG TPA: hypothetical protein PKX05_01525, partial [bacterium]|nr:hypothetical protein [bacterium]
ICGIILGLVFYPLLLSREKRIVEPFIGGETQNNNMRLSGTEFYNPVKEMRFLQTMYRASEKKVLDLYEVIKSFVLYLTEGFRSLHSGLLGIYLTWIFFGLIVFLYFFLMW